MAELTISAHTKISKDMDKGLRKLSKKRKESISYLMRMGIEIVLRSPELIELYKLNVNINR